MGINRSNEDYSPPTRHFVDESVCGRQCHRSYSSWRRYVIFWTQPCIRSYCSRKSKINIPSLRNKPTVSQLFEQWGSQWQWGILLTDSCALNWVEQPKLWRLFWKLYNTHFTVQRRHLVHFSSPRWWRVIQPVVWLLNCEFFLIYEISFSQSLNQNDLLMIPLNQTFVILCRNSEALPCCPTETWAVWVYEGNSLLRLERSSPWSCWILLHTTRLWVSQIKSSGHYPMNWGT